MKQALLAHRSPRNTAGFAMLEAAMVMTIIVGLITVGFALFDTLLTGWRLSSFASRLVESQKKGPLKRIRTGEGYRVAVDESALTTLEESLKQRAEGWTEQCTRPCRVEVVVGQVDFSPVTGAWGGTFDELWRSNFEKADFPSTPASLDAKTSISAALLRLLAKTDGIPDSPNFFAAPSGAASTADGGADGATRYRNQTLVIGVRVFTYLDTGLTGFFLEKFSDTRFLGTARAAIIRGEFT